MFLLLVFQLPRFAFRFDAIVLIIKGRNVCLVYKNVSLIMLGKIHKFNISLTRVMLMHISWYNSDEACVSSCITNAAVLEHIYVYTYAISNIMGLGNFLLNKVSEKHLIQSE